MATSYHKHPIIQKAEWEKAQLVLLSEPSLATLFGSLTPSAVNFTSSFSLYQAKREHQIFKEELMSRGIEVVEVRDLLSNLTEKGHVERLKEAAACSLTYLHNQRDYRQRDILKNLEPPDLVELIFLRPSIALYPSSSALDETTRVDAKYKLSPITNHYFMRDPLMTTQKGVVICNLFLEERKVEIEVVDLILSILEIEPLHRVIYPGRVEGGDFMPAGDYVLQGQGLLTNCEGVAQLLEVGAYGEVEVAVVKDPMPTMEAMHLDTYFNFLASDLAVIQKERIEGPTRPEVDIYRPKKNSDSCYSYEESMPFPDYLRSKGVELIEISALEQKNFAPNYLLLGEKDLIGVSKAGEEYFQRLVKHGVRVKQMDFSSLIKGYGGPHCMSQVLYRSN